jgi:hypothetical protein
MKIEAKIELLKKLGDEKKQVSDVRPAACTERRVLSALI